jgi:hypothetical protein
MAETIVIGTIDIDYDKAINDTVELKKKVFELSTELKAQAQATGKNSQEYVKLESELRNTKKELSDNQKNIDSLNTSQTNEIGTIKRLQAENAVMRKQQKSLNLETEQGIKDNNALVASINKNNEAIKGYSDTQSQGFQQIGQYDKGLSGIASTFISMPAPMQKASLAAKAFGFSMGLAILPITALVAIFYSLKAAFTLSEEGQNKWNKIMAVAGAIIGNINDVLADFGEKIISVFENPKQAIIDFANLIKQNIYNRFEGLLELVPQLGKSISLLFKGEFTEAGKVAVNAVAKVGLGVDNFTDKIESAIEATKKFINENEKEAIQAAKVADMRAKADIIERNLLIERAKLESQIAELRLKAKEQDKYTASERKKYLLEARDLEDSILQKETQYLTLRKDAQVLENTFSRTNKENKQKEAESIAAISKKEAERYTNARQIQRELNTLAKEEITELEKIAAEKLQLLDKEYQEWRRYNLEKITNRAEFNKQEYDELVSVAQTKLDLGLTTQEIYDQTLRDAKLSFEASEAARITEKEALERENKMLVLNENYLQELEAQRQKLDWQQEQEIAYAKSIGAETTDIYKRYADAKNEIDYLQFQSTLDIASQTAANLVIIFGETTTAGKIAATVVATIDTLQSAVSSFKAMAGIPYVGPILGGIAAAAALVAGYATVDQIWSVDTDIKGKTSTSKKSGSSSYASVGSKITSGAASSMASVNSALGQGIVARQTGIDSTFTQPTVEKIAIVDEVTAAQKLQTEKTLIAQV